MTYLNDPPLDLEQEGRRKWADSAVVQLDEHRLDTYSVPDAPSWIGQTQEFLEGGYVNKWGRERDFQRQKVYDATSDIPSGTTWSSIEEAEDALSDILDDWWLCQFFGSLEVDLRRARGRDSKYTWTSGIMRLTDEHLCLTVLLHELAHVLVPPPHAGHGRLFCRTFTELFTRMPPDCIPKDSARGWLDRIWTKHDVKWWPNT